MEEVEIPSYFLCPISLQIMRDPVTLSTGITYDRESIERWMFSGNQETCPVTKQPLPDLELTPNHTLRRLIQAWCTGNASHGIQRFPTPRPPINKAQIAALLDEAKLPHTRMSALRKLKAIVSESERNKRCVEASGAVDFLASVIKKSKSNPRENEHEGFDDGMESTSASDEALNILCSLQISKRSLLRLIERDDDFIESLTTILGRSNYQSRAHAILLLKALLSSMIAPARLMGFGRELFEEVVKVLRDQISYRATKAALQVLVWLSQWGRNRVRAVEAGAVAVMIELLLEETERWACEMMLVVLDQLCSCAEGRAEMVGHAAGLAVVSNNMLMVSQLASEKAVRILYTLFRFSLTPAVLQEMVQVGVGNKLCMVLQVDCGHKAKEKAKEILKVHPEIWRNSPCLAPQLLALHPCQRERERERNLAASVHYN